MISILSDMKITLKILENVEEDKEEFENQEEKQLNDYYKKLNCDIRSIEKGEKIYSILEKYNCICFSFCAADPLQFIISHDPLLFLYFILCYLFRPRLWNDRQCKKKS